MNVLNGTGDFSLVLSTALLEASNDFIWSVDQDFNLICGNKPFFELVQQHTGKMPEAGTPAFYFEPEANSNKLWHQCYEQIFRKGAPFTIEKEITVSGEKYYIAFNFSPMNNSKAETIAALIVGRNLTTDKAKQTELLKTRAIVDQAGEMLFLHDQEGNILDVNQAAIRQTGYSAKDLLSMKVSDLDPDVVERNDPQQIWDSLELTKKKVFQTKHRRKDGSYYPAEVSLSKIRIGDDFRLLGFVKDITMQQHSEAIQTARLGLLELASHCSLSELLRATLDEAEALSNSEISFIHFVEPDQNTISLQEWSTKTIDQYCNASPTEFHYPVEKAGVWVECIAEKRPVIHNDYDSLLNKKGHPEGHVRIIRELLVPVIRKGDVVAILGVGNKPEDYNDEDLETIAQWADLAWEIADRKRTEEALNKSMIRNAALVEAIPDLIFTLDKNGKYLSYKASPDELYYRESGIIGKYNRDLTPPEFADMVDEKIRLTLKTGKIQEFEYQIPISGKGLQFYEARMVHAGKNELITIVRNISERKKREESLRENEEKYRNIFQNAPLGLYRTSIADGRVLDCNNQMATMFGYSSREDFISGFFAQDTYVNIQDREKLLKEINETGLVRNFEVQLFRKDRKMFWASLTSKVYPEKGWIDGIAEDITERKQALEDLKESERSKNTLLGNLPGIAYRCRNDHDWTMEYISDGCMELTGYTPEELQMNKLLSFNSLIHKDDREMVWDDIQDSVKNQKSYQLQYRIITKTGTLKWVWEKGSGVFSHDQFIALEGFISDISESKRAEDLLHESETRYITFLNATSDIAFLKDDQFRYIISNQANADFLGQSLEEVIGKDDYMLMNHDAADNCRKSDELVLKEKSQVKTLEKVNKRTYEVTKFCVPLADGRTGVGGYARDITDQKKALDALRQSEEEFRGIFENAPVGIYRTTKEGRILMANDYLLRMLGYDNFEELASRNLEEEGYEPGYSRSKFLETIENDGKISGLESAWKTRNGKTIVVAESARIVTDKKGNIKYYEGMVVDITEQKAAELKIRESEANLRELNATKDKFFSIIAHDLKNPFNGILGFSDLLLTEARYIDVSEIETYARIINESANQALQLLNNLLQWARAQQGKIAFKPRNILLAEIANSVIAISANAILQKQIKVVNMIPQELIISADADMLKTVMLNLLTNAVKFSQNGGTIVINLANAGDEIQVKVKDNGIGISKENIEKLFRIDSGFTMRGTNNEKGTGLGLILCKEFIERHGGRIWVESEEEKGSTFIFTIPEQTDL